MQLNFMTVDVFTDRRFGGNPLAVVLDGRELTTQQMQSIAAEFNLAETTFVLPPKDPAHTAEVRIFTPRAELPFAGHPNIGTAFILARPSSAGGSGDREPIVFEEQAGLVKLRPDQGWDFGRWRPACRATTSRAGRRYRLGRGGGDSARLTE